MSDYMKTMISGIQEWVRNLVDGKAKDHIKKSELPNAINNALAQAKESGEFDGADGQDGVTPTIGDNGNWYLGETDTGMPSRGEKGDKGDTGAAFTYADFTPEQLTALKGEKGDKGDTGEKGEKGDTGETGATGAAGADGADGKSAYAYAQDGGYTGTKAEFAAKLAEDVSETWNLIDHFTVEKAALSYEVPLQEGAKEYAIYWEYENETLPQRSIMVSSDLADFGVMYRNVYNDRAFIRIFKAPNNIAVLGINTQYAGSRATTGGTYIGSGTNFPSMTLTTNIECTSQEIWLYWR